MNQGLGEEGEQSMTINEERMILVFIISSHYPALVELNTMYTDIHLIFMYVTYY
jgi:hypothetical protein